MDPTAQDRKEVEDFNPEPIDGVTPTDLNPEDEDTSNDANLPSWESVPSVSDLMYEIEASTSAYSSHLEKVNFRRTVLDGGSPVARRKGRSSYTPKLAKRQNQWRYSSLEHALLSSTDMLDAKPRGSDDHDNAEQVQALLNKQFYVDIDRVKLMGETVRAAADDGVCNWYVGWATEHKRVEYIEETFENIPVTQDPNEFSQLLARVESGELTEADIYEKKLLKSEKVFKDRQIFNGPTIDIVAPEDLMRSPLDKNTVIRRFKATKSELMAYSYYVNLDSLTPSSSKGEPTGSEHFTDSVKDRSVNASTDEAYIPSPSKHIYDIYEIWTLWDINGDNNLVPIVASICDNVIIRLEENPFPHKKPPFVFIQYDYDSSDPVYGGSSDVDLLDENQKVQGAIMRGVIDLLGRSANSQRGISRGALTPDQQRAFENGEDYLFNTGVDPEKMFHLHKYPEVPSSALNILSLMNSEAESLSGVKAFSSGLNGNSFGDVATGIRSTVDAISKRETSILRRIGRGIEEAARMILSMNAVNLSDKEIIQSNDGKAVTIDRDILAADYNIIFSVSTPEKDMEQAENLSFLLQTIGNNLPPELSYMIMADISRLKGNPTLAKKLSEFTPQPDPVEQQKNQLEILSLQAEIESKKATAAYYNAQAALAMGKTGTEKAKTTVLQKDAEKRDLDYVDRIEGTDLKRQKELKDHDFHLALGKEAAGSLLNKDTPNAVHGDMASYISPSPAADGNEDIGMTDASDTGSEALRR